MSRIAFALALYCSLLVAACTASLTPLRPNEAYTLQPDEGLLMMRVQGNVPLTKVEVRTYFKAEIALSRNSSEQVILVPLPSGRYRISRLFMLFKHHKYEVDPIGELIWQRSTEREYFIEFQRNEPQRWDFELASGAINYIGDLMVERESTTARVGAILTNRSSFAHKYLKQHHPSLIEKVKVRWAGQGDDTFFDWFPHGKGEADDR